MLHPAEQRQDGVRRLTPKDTGAGYDSLAGHWAGDAFPRDNGLAAHRRALAFLTAAAGAGPRRALDVGCGSSGRLIDLLQAAGLEIEGVDVSARMLELARLRHPDVTFHLADVCAWPLPHRYEFISAWDSIWHVPLPDQEPLLRKLLGALASGGVCIFTLGGLDAPSEKTDSAMGPLMYYATLGIPRTLAVLAEAGCVCRHLEYDQHPEPHVYIIAQRL
jgi:SAM-dependent methyltransferase